MSLQWIAFKASCALRRVVRRSKQWAVRLHTVSLQNGLAAHIYWRASLDLICCRRDWLNNFVASSNLSTLLFINLRRKPCQKRFYLKFLNCWNRTDWSQQKMNLAKTGWLGVTAMYEALDSMMLSQALNCQEWRGSNPQPPVLETAVGIVINSLFQ